MGNTSYRNLSSLYTGCHELSMGGVYVCWRASVNYLQLIGLPFGINCIVGLSRFQTLKLSRKFITFLLLSIVGCDWFVFPVQDSLI